MHVRSALFGSVLVVFGFVLGRIDLNESVQAQGVAGDAAGSSADGLKLHVWQFGTQTVPQQLTRPRHIGTVEGRRQ